MTDEPPFHQCREDGIHVCKGADNNIHVRIIFVTDQKMPFLVSIIRIMLHVWSMDCRPVVRLGEGYISGKISS
jgi:hypothetical protein